MSIEQARPAESRPSATAPAGASGGAHRAQAADGGVGASFLALLGAMDVGAEDLTPAAAAPGDDPLATGMTPRHGKADKGGRRDARGHGLSAEAGDTATGEATDATDSLAAATGPDTGNGAAGQDTPPDGAAAWAGALPWAMLSTTVPTTVPQALPVQPQAVATTATATTTPDASTLAVGAEGAARRTPLPRGGEALAQAGDVAQAAQGASARTESSAVAGAARSASQHMAGQAQAAADSQASQRSQTLQQVLQQQAAQQQAQATPTATHAAAREAAAPESLGPALAGALAAAADPSASRGLSRVQERIDELRGAGTAAAAEGAHSRHTLSADAPLPVATAQIDTGGAGMEDRLNAQVSWWLSQKTQSAELTLNTADGQAVDVRIAMNGNEAQVQFRAEQAGTRELLGSALNQLQDALGREGVVLAGVTVDSFGARSQGDSGEGSGRQGARSGGRRSLSIGEVAGAGAGVPVARSGQAASARGLDLYV